MVQEEPLGVIADLSSSLKNLQTDFTGIADKVHEPLQNLGRVHLESYNYAVGEGLQHAIEDLPIQKFKLKNGSVVGLQIRDAVVGKPENSNSRAVTSNLYPSECRLRGTSYSAGMKLKIAWYLNDDQQEQGIFERHVGDVPVMIKSNLCHLKDASPQQLVLRGEEETEFGGYFIINGNEKLIRLLVTQRANYPMAIKRSNWGKKEKYFTEQGISIRCVKKDGSSNTNVLHYLNNGTCILAVLINREPFYIPAIMLMRALIDWSDKEIFYEIMKSQEDNQYLKGCVLGMLRQLPADDVDTQEAALKFIGSELRSKIREAEFLTDEEIALEFFRQCVGIHLKTPEEKVRLLAFMIRKLFSFVRNGCAAENPDSPTNQDILTSGAIFLLVLKERLDILIRTAGLNIKKFADRVGHKLTLSTQFISEEFAKAGLLTRPLQYFLATGNLNPKSLIHVQQTSGFAVLADKINYLRFMAHFRSVHRGAFFQEMRTTACRKLLPEAWGFVCPVHTPDGAPCGLLNHLAAACRIFIASPPSPDLVRLLRSVGMLDPDGLPVEPFSNCYAVVLDGCVIGWLPEKSAQQVVEILRCMKTEKTVPPDLEIGFVPKNKYGGQFPGIFLFLESGGRFERPVRNLVSGKVEWIGSLEQVYLNIATTMDEVIEGRHTHAELTQQVFLSEVAAMTPFSDHNQSPRNLYQCQMGKQSMATPVLNWPQRSDNKLYRVMTPQTPLIRPAAHQYYNMDQHPMGVNAIVAVISYTGYDMEDAMVINKASFERGFGYGCIYKSEFVDLRELSKASRQAFVFGLAKADPDLRSLGSDGLPFVGTRLKRGDPLYCYYDKTSLVQRIEYYDDAEMAVIDSVRCLGSDSGSESFNSVCITLRIPRPPTVGDKFASRHGQKGVCSRLYPVEDMPFTESGMTPDIIFNPHGYPSRMTIGMMIETMAGKAAAVKGLSYDASPFVYGEDNTAIGHFGDLLQAAGYNYFGNEIMYSGIDGRQLEVSIFFGVVYYQRLRHMVSDKFQVRTTGAVDEMTGQPIKGRKRGGGTRFGEMERDALISHGASYLLQDRLFNCSDRVTCYCCNTCGSILSPIAIPGKDSTNVDAEATWICQSCPDGGEISTVDLPQVFRYLIIELASCNMKVKLELDKG